MRLLSIMAILFLVLAISGCTSQTPAGGENGAQDDVGDIPTSDLEYWNLHKDEYTRLDEVSFLHSGNNLSFVGKAWKGLYHTTEQGNSISVGYRLTAQGDVMTGFGDHMEGGSIKAQGNAGTGVGSGMRGGQIEVLGNAGRSVGYKMESGSITVHGNVGHTVGYEMISGFIRVVGNADHSAGIYMKDGRIVIEGDAAERVGEQMEGGEIVIYGKVDGLIGANMEGGKIIVKCEGVPQDQECTGTVGHRMYGGKIYIKGKAGPLEPGFHPTGGEIWEYWESFQGRDLGTRIYPN